MDACIPPVETRCLTISSFVASVASPLQSVVGRPLEEDYVTRYAAVRLREALLTLPEEDRPVRQFLLTAASSSSPDGYDEPVRPSPSGFERPVLATLLPVPRAEDLHPSRVLLPELIDLLLETRHAGLHHLEQVHSITKEDIEATRSECGEKPHGPIGEVALAVGSAAESTLRIP